MKYLKKMIQRYSFGWLLIIPATILDIGIIAGALMLCIPVWASYLVAGILVLGLLTAMIFGEDNCDSEAKC